jgi:serine phosphatase RsbU (regulator of sigma subunit)
MRSRIALSFGLLLTFGTFLAFIDLTKLVTSLLGIPLQMTIVNLTWVFDLILFVFMAIVTGLQLAVQHTQQQQISDKLQNLTDRLELASTVQSTLLPNPMHGQRGSIEWHCFYVAAERLAGDWVFMSEDRHHPTRFYLGDVTGKGPAAAIAVAAIISLLRKKDFEPSTITNTMKELNKHLFHLFRGNASSAVCMAEVSDDGQAQIISNGMAGWIHLSPGKVRMIQTRGSILGAADHLDVTIAETKLSEGDYLICFSDGCLEGQRHLRRLSLQLEKQPSENITADDLFKIVTTIGQDSVLPDDKAMLVIHRITTIK